MTLSIRADVVKRARSRLAMEGRRLSNMVEEFLSLYGEAPFLDGLCTSLVSEADSTRAPKLRQVGPEGPGPRKSSWR